MLLENDLRGVHCAAVPCLENSNSISSVCAGVPRCHCCVGQVLRWLDESCCVWKGKGLLVGVRVAIHGQTEEMSVDQNPSAFDLWQLGSEDAPSPPALAAVPSWDHD